MTQWHIAMTLPNQEQRVVDALLELEGFEAVWPRYRKRFRMGVRQRRPLSGGRPLAEELRLVSAYPNYIAFAGPSWHKARKIDGLTTVIRSPGDRDRPAVISPAALPLILGPAGDGLIEELCETIETMHRYLRGQGVKVISGLLTGSDGVVVSSTLSRVRLLIGATQLDVPVSAVRSAA